MNEADPIIISEETLSAGGETLFQSLQRQQLEAMDSEHWHALIEESPGVKWKTRTTHGGGCPICGTGYCVRAGGEVEIGSEKWAEFSRAIGWDEEEIAGWCAPALLKDLDEVRTRLEKADATFAAVRGFIDAEMDELREHRKAVFDKDGEPDFQYSHDQSRWDTLKEVLAIVDGEDSKDG